MCVGVAALTIWRPRRVPKPCLAHVVKPPAALLTRPPIVPIAVLASVLVFLIVVGVVGVVVVVVRVGCVVAVVVAVAVAVKGDVLLLQL